MMKKYYIYTTNSTEPFIVETDEDLILDLDNRLENNFNTMRIKHTKSLMSGTFNYVVLLNVNNIVSITTSEKV